MAKVEPLYVVTLRTACGCTRRMKTTRLPDRVIHLPLPVSTKNVWTASDPLPLEASTYKVRRFEYWGTENFPLDPGVEFMEYREVVE